MDEEEQKARHREYAKRWEEKPGNLERKREAYREWAKRYKAEHGHAYRNPARVLDREGWNRRERDRQKRRYQADPAFRERVKRQVKEWRQANPEKVKALNRLTPARQQRARARTLAQYGLTPEEYQAKLAAQDGVCAICRQPERNLFRGKPRPLAVDHQHGTEQVRGLLCSRCNNMIGRAEDDPAILMAGAQYLIRWSGTPMQYVPPER